MNRLLLGSGSWRWAGWETVDADPDNHPDYLAAIPPLPTAILSSRWDVIMAVHFIEHLPPWKASDLLKSCYDILKPNGILILEQPNIEYCARCLLGLETPPAGGAPGQFDLWGFYGDPGHRNEWMLHRWGYSPRTMTELLVNVGFPRDCVEVREAQFHQPVRDFRIEARKS